MRLLIINRISDRAEVGLYSGLKSRGVDLQIILDPNDPSSADLKKQNIPVYNWPIRHRFDFSFDRQLKELLKQHKFDCIFAPTSRGIAAALRVTRTPDMRLVTYRGTMGNLSRFNPLNYLGHLNSRVSTIVCNCKAVKSYMLQQGVPAEKLAVVYKGHKPEWYRSQQPGSRASFKLDHETLVVGCIANVRPLKGVNYLVEAVKLLVRDLPIVVLVAGKVEDTSVVRYVQSNGLQDHVRFLGFQRDVSSLLDICDLTVMPSVRREGVPRAIIESFCNNKPVICTAVGGMPEIVVSGMNGLVVAPADTQALANAISQMYREPEFRKQSGINGYATVTSKLAHDNYVSNMLSVFEGTAEA